MNVDLPGMNEQETLDALTGPFCDQEHLVDGIESLREAFDSESKKARFVAGLDLLLSFSDSDWKETGRLSDLSERVEEEFEDPEAARTWLREIRAGILASPEEIQKSKNAATTRGFLIAIKVFVMRPGDEEGLQQLRQEIRRHPDMANDVRAGFKVLTAMQDSELARTVRTEIPFLFGTDGDVRAWLSEVYRRVSS